LYSIEELPMVEYSAVYDEFIETGKVAQEDLAKLLQYLQKNKSCIFTMKYCGKLPLINTDGYTVGIKSPETEVLVSMATFIPTIMLALAKYRTQIL
jgi:hypothetical protein